MTNSGASTKPTRQRPKRLRSSGGLSSWEQRFKELELFRKEHGHCNVPTRYQPNPALGKWAVNVRQAKKHGMLTEEKARRLDALGFCWVMKQFGVLIPWEQRINELNAFKKEHGHCNVPGKYQPNPALGRWVAATRHRKKRGKLAEDKIRILDALGFCWLRLEKPHLPTKQTLAIESESCARATCRG